MPAKLQKPSPFEPRIMVPVFDFLIVCYSKGLFTWNISSSNNKVERGSRVSKVGQSFLGATILRKKYCSHYMNGKHHFCSKTKFYILLRITDQNFLLNFFLLDTPVQKTNKFELSEYSSNRKMGVRTLVKIKWRRRWWQKSWVFTTHMST